MEEYGKKYINILLVEQRIMSIKTWICMSVVCKPEFSILQQKKKVNCYFQEENIMSQEVDISPLLL